MLIEQERYKAEREALYDIKGGGDEANQFHLTVNKWKHLCTLSDDGLDGHEILIHGYHDVVIHQGSNHRHDQGADNHGQESVFTGFVPSVNEAGRNDVCARHDEISQLSNATG